MPDVNTLLIRLGRWLEPERFREPRVRGAALVIGAAAFVGGIAWSFMAQPLTVSEIRWTHVTVIALVFAPMLIALNAVEIVVSASLARVSIGFAAALETSVIASAANLLPLPGGALVRIAVMKGLGADYAKGTIITVAMAGLWLGVACLIGGSGMLAAGAIWPAGVFLAAGLALTPVMLAVMYRQSRDVAATALATTTKFGLVVADAALTYTALSAIGAAADIAQASALTVSSVFGAAVSIVPAGLGVREVTAAGLGALVGLSSASAFLATALIRVTVYGVVGMCALALAWRLKA